METKKQYKERLWKDYLDSREDLQQELKAQASVVGELFTDDVSYLYMVRKCVLRGGGAIEDEATQVQYEAEGEYHILRYESTELALRQNEMAVLLADMIDIFEDILPLGSVVDLNKAFLSRNMNLSGVENMRMVITKRFIGGETGCYYPYAAVVYPIGMGGEDKSFCFSAALIERVVHMGYSDSTEDAFIYGMKDRLIVKEHRRSMGFATEEESKEMARLLFGKGD